MWVCFSIPSIPGGAAYGNPAHRQSGWQTNRRGRITCALVYLNTLLIVRSAWWVPRQRCFMEQENAHIYLVIYLVWPHQSCWSTCAAMGLVGLQSSKKPIRDCFSRCKPFLKLFTVLAFTVWWSKLFHLLTSRSVKKCRLTSNLLLCLVSFNSWPAALW